MSDQIPTDAYSRELRALEDNPGAHNASSTIRRRDFYGNTESWLIATYRHDGRDTVFIETNTANGGARLLLPPEITAALARHRDQLATRTRRRAARQAVETKRTQGQRIGNPEALRKARRKKR